MALLDPCLTLACYICAESAAQSQRNHDRIADTKGSIAIAHPNGDIPDAA
jgi:hypothetical protein